MFVYLFLYFIPLMVMLSTWAKDEYISLYSWGVVLVVFVLLIGLRFEVGPDWFSYIAMFERAKNTNLLDIYPWVSRDIGFAFLNWLFANYLNLNDGYLYVNTMSAIFLMLGVIGFSRKFNVSWLVFSSSIPYIIIVIGMGYQRQSIAIGFELLALSCLIDSERTGQLHTIKFIGLIILGALFHKTLLITLPLILLVGNHSRLIIIPIISISLIGLYSLLFSNDIDLMVYSYVESQKESGGALFRISLNLLLIMLCLLFFYRLSLSALEYKLIIISGVISIGALLMVSSFSTLVDRIYLYVIPIQMLIIGKLSELFLYGMPRVIYNTLVYLFFLVLLILWLILSSHGNAWMPYEGFRLNIF